jgi:TonB family protein
MMACLNVRELQGYLEDGDNQSLRQTVESHLPGCGKCRSVFEKLAATNRRVNMWLAELAMPAEEVPMDVAAAYARVVDHASPVVMLDVEMPWYESLYRSVRDLVRPEKLPPLEVTSRPVPVKEIWGLYANDPKHRLYAVGIHVLATALLMAGFTSPVVQQAIRQKFELIDPSIAPYTPKVNMARGGGGGGAREPMPVTKGQLPKPSMKQFVPPMITDHTPKLAMDASIIAPPDTPVPQTVANNWGDPLAKMVNGSNGSGSGGGMGNGTGGGVGSGGGGGLGPGYGGGVGGGVFRVGGGVSAPTVLFRVDPEYSEEARKAKYSGTVMLSVIVDSEGHARDIHVVKSLGMGLDEKAMEAVAKWKFKPGTRNGLAVNVRAQIEVNFRLL